MAYEQKCIICDEAITNPVCPECLERQVMYWIADFKPELISILRDIGSSVKTFNHSNTSCIICGSEMNVCAHCYCKEIYLWLIENKHVELAMKFLESFNFELDYRFDLKAQPCKDHAGIT